MSVRGEGRGYIVPESVAWTRPKHFTGYLCNYIGCCRRCGTCRTWAGHTPSYCDLLVKQAREREDARP